MSTSTFTSSSTYTITDIAKVLDRFAADLHMIAQATGLASAERVEGISHDVKLMAQRRYLDRVDIVLRDAYGTDLRAAKYAVSADAPGWTSERPGNNLWPRTPGGELSIVVSYTTEWWAMSQGQRDQFQREDCWRPWGPSDIDTSYPTMTGRFDRRYSSNAFGLERTVYEGGSQ